VVIVNLAPNINVTASDALICNGQSATITVTGAGSYLWSNNATSTVIVVNPTQSTLYTVVGTDNTSSCTATGSANIDVFTPTVSIVGSTAICSGETATLQASGANSYTWSNGALFSGTNVSPLTTTVYTLSAISNSMSVNCAISSTFQVTVRANPTITAQADRTVACRNETVTVTALGASSYIWNNNATTPAISITSSLVTTVQLSVTGTDANGCKGGASTFILINGCTGLNGYNSISEINIYPNPASNNFIITSDSEMELTIINQIGAVVKAITKSSAKELVVDISDLAPGIYFVRGQQGQNQINEKLIINK
jgi:hypothetical protein